MMLTRAIFLQNDYFLLVIHAVHFADDTFIFLLKLIAELVLVTEYFYTDVLIFLL